MNIYAVMHLSVMMLLMMKSTGSQNSTKRRTKRMLGYPSTCPPGCSACSAVNGCLSCHSNMYLFLLRDGPHQSGVCLHSCPSGYFALELPTLKRCFKCRITNCESCYSNSYCKTCAPPYTLYNGKCIMRCPPGLYYETYSRTCMVKVDCAVGEWSGWSECTRNSQICGYKYGLQSRTRPTIQNPSPRGLACPTLNEYRQCRMLHRYCADLETNHSKLMTHMYAAKKRQQRRRARRKRCRQRGKIWRKGECLRPPKRHIVPLKVPDTFKNTIPDVFGNALEASKANQITSHRTVKKNNL